MKRLNEQEKSQLYTLYWEQNLTLPQIANRFGVTYSAIRIWFIKLGIPRRTNSDAQILSNGTVAITKEVLEQLYYSGMSQDAIANHFGIFQSAIKEKMKRFGIKARNTANPGKANGMFGRTHTLEAREKIRQANQKQFSDPLARERHALLTCKQIQSGKTGKSYNKLETIIASTLSAKSINFTQQYRIGRFLFDFYLPDSNTLIEVHGTFWHADPRRYGDKPLSKIQQRNVANDINKAERATKDGFKLIIIWEYDVYHSPNPLIELYVLAQ